MIKISTYFLFLLLVVVVLIMVKIDRKFTGDILSPFYIFVVPSTIVLGVTIAYSSSNKTIDSIGPKIILVYLVFFIILWVINIFLVVLIKQILTIRKPPHFENAAKFYKKFSNAMRIIGVVSAIYLIINFFVSAGSLNVMGSIVQEEFQDSYSGGFNFYIRLICMISASYFLGHIKKGNKLELFLAILCLIPLFLSFVKGIIFIPIIAGVIYKISLNKNMKITKPFFTISIIGILIFFAVYAFEFGIWDVQKIFDKELYIFIFDKLIIYIVSGTLSFNANLNFGFYQSLLISENPNVGIIINSLSKLGIGERIDTIANQWTYIGDFKEVGSTYVNVNGMIGSLVLFSGYTQGTIIFVFYCVFICLIYIRSKYTNNIVYKLSYAMFISAFFLAWFENYFFHTFWLYILIYLEILGAFYYLLKKTKLYKWR